MTTILDAEQNEAGIWVCRPRWSTPRDPSRPTYGARLARVGEVLGQPFLPWQRDAADVAFEADPDTGELIYRQVVITVPRQSGKTTLILAMMVFRAMWRALTHLIYTAQTRNDARKKWEDEHIPIVQASEYAPLVKVRKTTGAEAFIWRNKSIHGLISATKKSGHGPPLDVGVIDEAFAQTDDRLEQAFRPAMITRRSPQIWVVSTAGTVESLYFRSKIDTGRKMVEAGLPTSTMFLDYSAPDDADPLDERTWWECMPALGRTVPIEAIRAELRSLLDEHGPDGLDLFRRAYLNQWPDQLAKSWLIIPSIVWRGRSGAEGRPAGPVVFGISGSWPDADQSSITMVGRNGGEVFAQVVEHRPGTSWLAGRAKELRERWPDARFTMDDKDPAAGEKPNLAAVLGDRLTALNQTQLGQAYAAINSAIRGDKPNLRHYGQKSLDDAVAGAQNRPVGDAFTWARRGVADISPLVGMTNAHFVLLSAPPPAPAPNIF